MLSAICENGKKVYADEEDKKNGYKYYCPECNQELVLRQGTKNIWHFSHKTKNDDCLFAKYENESKTHRLMKKTIKKMFENHDRCVKAELEYKVGSRIADCYFEMYDDYGKLKKIAIECVHKHTDINVFREKAKYYMKHNVYVLWLFDASRFTYDEKNCPIDLQTSKNKEKLKNQEIFKLEVRINEMIKEAHTMYFGKVYVINTIKKEIYAVHLESVYREYYTSDGNRYGKWLKRTKEVFPEKINNVTFTSFQKINNDSFLPYNRSITNMDIEKWW